ncbi:hypothetical protein [Streptomyces sp. NBC_01262]|uniref:hypothetical protein n=1 Tax=Streptomyces sp. NBC_01262 TaxID=2903803 RepID=UPI002E34F1D1|nr:hypothetical protein [Streptomyces sp. NBC_01262]
MTWTTDTMRVEYAQYYLCGPDFGSDPYDTLRRVREGNTVAAGGPEHLTVICGTNTGNIRLTVEVRDDPPAGSEPSWETAVDVSICSVSGKLGLEGWGGAGRPDAGNLAQAGSGWYRIRIETRGRDRGRERNSVGTWVEEHRLTIWPAPPESDRVHRIGDELGRHRYDPQRPPLEPIRPAEPSPGPGESADDAIRAWAGHTGLELGDTDPIPSFIREAARLAGVPGPGNA